MRWILFIIFLLVIAGISYLGYVVFSVFTNVESVNSCNIDTDCIIVKGVDVCMTPESINENYAFRWSKKTAYTHWLYELTNLKCNEEKKDLTYFPICENFKCKVLMQ